MTAQRVRGDVAVLLAAAGAGVRLGAGVPKALIELAGESLLAHAVRRLAAAPSVGQVVVAAPPEAVGRVSVLVPGHPVVAGATSRRGSVAAALAAADPDYPIVLVHDAARALAPVDLIERVAAAVRAGHDAVIPVLPVVDTVKRVDPAGRVLATVDRGSLRSVQTPQGFRREVLVAAHAAADPAAERTDDAALAEDLGVPVWTVPGDVTAFKITAPFDLRVALALLSGELERRPGR